MKVAIIQLNSTDNKSKNLAIVEALIREVCQQEKPKMIALPEMFNFMGGDLVSKKKAAEDIEKGESVSLLKKLASQYGIYLHGGSLCEKAGERYFNTTPIINPQGKLIAIYRKIHLFSFSGQHSDYRESSLYSQGEEIVTYLIGEVLIGSAICFDLRFADLFYAYKKCRVRLIIVPSAFTYETGSAHWEVLLRARAIETQSFIVAPAQTGSYQRDEKQDVNWGHSMIVDPWGNVLTRLKESVGYSTACLDFKFLEQVRKRLPV
jgi:predicted amidohydrolase